MRLRSTIEAGYVSLFLGQALRMVRIYRFAGVRPEPSEAQAIAAVPYDVVTTEEARAIIARDPESFLRVSRADAELSDISPYDERIYQRARENFLLLLSNGQMRMDREPGMYLYEVKQDGETFLGLCCCLDVDDYQKNRIRRHEQTRYDKEEDRTRHIEATKAHNGPVVLLYRDSDDLFSTVESLIGTSALVAEVAYGRGVHRIYRIADAAALSNLESLFAAVPALYIADGHHRAKAAVNVADRQAAAGKPATGEVARFMGVMFAHNRVKIHGYSRLLTDLGSYTPSSFMDAVKMHFSIGEYGLVDGKGYNIAPKIAHPEKFHVVHMYIGGKWYECSRPVDTCAASLDTLDVAVLQKLVLEPLLGITDPRGDSRLQYLGGARPVADLEKLVNDGKYQLAFAMQPVRVETVMAIADAGGVMPPKSTWFEPKLLSGLVVHTFD